MILLFSNHIPLTYGIGLRVPQAGRSDTLLGGNLLGGPVADEQGLSTPLERHRLAFGDISQLHLDLGHGQHIGGCTHRGDELCHHRLGSVRGHHAGTWKGCDDDNKEISIQRFIPSTPHHLSILPASR